MISWGGTRGDWGAFVPPACMLKKALIYTIQLLPKRPKLSHSTCSQLELYCVNQAHSSPKLSQASCVLDLHSTTQVVSRLHATVLGKSCVV